MIKKYRLLIFVCFAAAVFAIAPIKRLQPSRSSTTVIPEYTVHFISGGHLLFGFWNTSYMISNILIPDGKSWTVPMGWNLDLGFFEIQKFYGYSPDGMMPITAPSKSPGV